MQSRKRGRDDAAVQQAMKMPRYRDPLEAPSEPNEMVMTHGYDKETITETITRYMDLLPFANQLDFRTRPLDDETLESMAVLEKVMSVLRKHRKIAIRGMEKLEHAVSRRPGWYGDADIFAMDHDLLVRMLGVDMTHRDPDDLGAYLLDLLPKYFEEHAKDYWTRYEDFTHQGRVLNTILSKMWYPGPCCSRAARYWAFQVAAVIEAARLRWDINFRSELEGRIHKILWVSTDIGFVMGGSWLCGTYVNHALAARQIRGAYDETECDAEQLFEDAEDGSEFSVPLAELDSCSKRSQLPLLEVLYKQAWNEIRFGVMSTIGSRLSADVTELIFEHVLDAEQVPRDPKLVEGIDPPKKMGGYGEISKVRPRPQWKCDHREYD